MSQTVQNANTHILRSQNQEHAHSSRSVQGSVQWGAGRRFKECSKGKDSRQHTARHTQGTHIQFSGAMDEMSGKVQNSSTHPLRRQRHEHAHNSRSVQVRVQGGDGCKFRESSKCKHTEVAVLSWILQP
eukprot:scaffold38033_cov69-Phaeocystis_antarctica.AAC.2